MSERILQLTPGSISKQWFEDGVAIDPGTVTIGITRADGTVLVAAGTATGGVTTAPRTFALTTTHSTLLDQLKATWTSTNKGTLTSYVEIVGGFLFSMADLDALLQTPSSFTVTKKVAARLWSEQRVEKCIGRSFVPRYAYETLDGQMYRGLATGFRPVRLLRSIETRSGQTWVAQTVANYDIGYSSIEGFPSNAGFYSTSVAGYFPNGFRNVRVGYEYGEDAPNENVSYAAALLAKVRLVTGPVDDRELQRFISDTGAVVNLSTPGRNSWTGVPDVDAVIESERIPLVG